MNGRIEVVVYTPRDRRFLQLAWIDPDGARRFQSARTTDPDQADRARADLEYELNHGAYRRPARLSWEGFREALEAEALPHKAPNTRKTVRRALNLFERLARPGGLAALDARTVARFHTAMVAEGYAPRSIKTYLDSLHGALAWAVDPGGLIAAVPSFPDVIVPPQRPRPLPAEHYEHLLERAGQLRPLLELGWHAGLRIGEAARLCWEETGREPWVDLEAKRLRFPVGGQKAKREDWIPIAPPLLAVLEALPREGRRVVPLFRQDGSPVKDSYRTDYADKRFRELARGAGVRATFHGLRKAFGTRYAARVPAQVLQRLMRHSSIAVTLAYYCDLGDAMIEAVNTSFNSDPADLAKPLENKGSAKAGG